MSSVLKIIVSCILSCISVVSSGRENLIPNTPMLEMEITACNLTLIASFLSEYFFLTSIFPHEKILVQRGLVLS